MLVDSSNAAVQSSSTTRLEGAAVDFNATVESNELVIEI